MSWKNKPSLMAGVLVALIGIGLHLHVALKADGGLSAFTLALLAGSALPYALCLLVATFGRRPLHAAVAATFCLGLDLFIYRSVFISPTSSTAALGLLIAPFANLLVMAPAGFLATTLVLRLRNATTR